MTGEDDEPVNFAPHGTGVGTATTREKQPPLKELKRILDRKIPLGFRAPTQEDAT